MSKRRATTPERFVRVWQASSSVQQAARILGMTERGARGRASKYRTRGVLLKMFKSWSSKTRIDVRFLNQVIVAKLDGRG